MYLESFVLTLSLSLLMFLIFIPILKKKKITQTVRSEGPSMHITKNGTPTFGGVIFVLSTLVVFLFYSSLYKYQFKNIIALIYPTVIFAIIGFLDDGLIVHKKENNGLSAKIKLLFQVLASFVYSLILKKLGYDTIINLFGYKIDFGIFYYPFIIFIIVGSSNAFNLTDGIDGLSGGSFSISMIALIMLASYKNYFDITIYCIIILASVLAFLCFNYKNASIFMGDSGSLSLGATLAAVLILLEMEVLLVFIGIIYLLETLSVIIQVGYFKLTKGKRLFKMSPIHHHFELVGLNEMKIDVLFWIISLIGSVVGLYLGLKYY